MLQYIVICHRRKRNDIAGLVVMELLSPVKFAFDEDRNISTRYGNNYVLINNANAYALLICTCICICTEIFETFL